MRLRLGAAEHDLTTRSLVMAVVESGLRRAGAATTLDGVLAEAEAAGAAGADLLDLGGPAAGMGGPMGEDEELARTVPAVEALRARIDVPLAVFVSRPAVLMAAAAAGAVMATDGPGLAGDDRLRAAAGAGIAIVLDHSRPAGPAGPGPSGIVGQVRAVLEDRVISARAAGVADDRMVLDAGLDLGGTSSAQSLALLRESAALADLGPPLLLDASNKRFLGLLLDLDVGERRMASHAAAALGIARGCRVVRAHDVRGARRVADVLAALLGARLTHVTARAGQTDHG